MTSRPVGYNRKARSAKRARATESNRGVASVRKEERARRVLSGASCRARLVGRVLSGVVLLALVGLFALLAVAAVGS